VTQVAIPIVRSGIDMRNMLRRFAILLSFES
jgi:hypothetical protein